MKRLLAVALLCAIALTLAPAAQAGGILYKELGPIPLRTGYGAVTGSADSAARNFNTACAGGSVDTTADFVIPNDCVWGSLTDSLPLIVVVRRIGGTGASTDTIQVGLDLNYGGSVYPTSRTDAANGWGFSTVALVGAGTGGVAIFKPSIAATQLLDAINTYTVVPRSYGATKGRCVVRSYSGAASAGRYSVYFRYPIKTY